MSVCLSHKHAYPYAGYQIQERGEPVCVQAAAATKGEGNAHSYSPKWQAFTLTRNEGSRFIGGSFYHLSNTKCVGIQ
jgi:hypothetical protein